MESCTGNSTAPYSCLTTDVLPVLSSTFPRSETFEQVRDRGKSSSPHHNRLAPLNGKKIFMHYDPGTPPDRRVESILTKLKADLVDFFSREIDYVITNRPPPRIPRNSAQLDNHSQEVTCTNPGSEQSSNDSKATISSMKPMSATLTRGRAMLMAARNVSPTANIMHASPPEPSVISIFNQIRLKQTTGGPPITIPTNLAPTKTPSNDLLVRARHLGIRILSLDSVLKWIRSLPPDVQAHIQSCEQNDVDENFPDVPEDPERDRIHQVRHLTAPCVKIVDLAGQFRPLYLDRTDFLPSLWSTFSRPTQQKDVALSEQSLTQTACGSGTLPAASIGRPIVNPPSHRVTRTHSVLSQRHSHTTKKVRANKKSHTTKNTPSLRRSTSTPIKMHCAADRSKAAMLEPSGFCECCSLAFPNLLEHLQSVEHEQFICNVENYRPLDRLFNQMPSVKSFLASDSNRKRPTLPDRRRKHHKTSDTDTNLNGQPDVGQPAAVLASIENHIPPPPELVDGHLPSVIETIGPHSPPCLRLPEPMVPVSSAETADRVELFSDEEEEIGFIRKRLLDAADRSSLASPPVFAGHISPVKLDSVIVQQSIFTVSCVNSECPQDVLVPLSNNHVDTVDRALNNPILSPTPDPELLHAWHSVCSSVHVGKLLKDPPDDGQDSRSSLLEQFHRSCLICHRLHIPTSFPPSLRLQLHSLLGPCHKLDGVGCLGMQSPLVCETPPSSVSCIHQSETNSPTIHSQSGSNTHHLSHSAPSSVHNSPVFETNEVECCVLHDATLSTIQMTQCSSSHEDIEDSYVPSKDGKHDALPLSGEEVVSRTACDKVESVARALGKSSESILSTSLRLSEPNSPGSYSPGIHSETIRGRASLGWFFNNSSFDAKLSPTDRSTESSVSSLAPAADPQPTSHASSPFGPEETTVESLPIIRHPKQSSPKAPSVSQPPEHSSLFNRNCERNSSAKRLRNNGFTDSSTPQIALPQRSPRVAAQIARESINLSVRTFYYPSTMDSFSDSPENSHVPSLSPLKRLAINSSYKSLPKPSKSTHSRCRSRRQTNS